MQTAHPLLSCGAVLCGGKLPFCSLHLGKLDDFAGEDRQSVRCGMNLGVTNSALVYIDHISSCGDKIPNKHNLTEERFVLAQSLRRDAVDYGRDGVGNLRQQRADRKWSQTSGHSDSSSSEAPLP